MLKQSPDSFVTVARTIANGNPPKWLAPALDGFSGFVGSKRGSNADSHRARLAIVRAHDAARDLMKFLQAHLHLSIGRPSADMIAALDVLPRIKTELGRRMKARRVKRPYVQRRVCAAVVVEVWASVRGNVEPRSIELFQACDDYWRACGNEDRGQDVENWRRDVAHAIAEPQDWIKQIITELQAVHN
jgi:hypothetical protein